MRRASSIVLWFALLFGLWELLVGTFQLSELVAGLLAAAVGTGFAELVRSLGLFEPPSRGWLRAVKLCWQLPVELLVVTWALAASLARGRRVRGTWLTVPYDGDPAAASVVGTASPNAIVVDVTGGEALLHAIRADLPGGSEAL